jgi:hypothetical protein
MLAQKIATICGFQVQADRRVRNNRPKSLDLLEIRDCCCRAMTNPHKPKFILRPEQRQAQVFKVDVFKVEGLDVEVFDVELRSLKLRCLNGVEGL